MIPQVCEVWQVRGVAVAIEVEGLGRDEYPQGRLRPNDRVQDFFPRRSSWLRPLASAQRSR